MGNKLTDTCEEQPSKVIAGGNATFSRIVPSLSRQQALLKLFYLEDKLIVFWR